MIPENQENKQTIPVELNFLPQGFEILKSLSVKAGVNVGAIIDYSLAITREIIEHQDNGIYAGFYNPKTKEFRRLGHYKADIGRALESEDLFDNRQM